MRMWSCSLLALAAFMGLMQSAWSIPAKCYNQVCSDWGCLLKTPPSPTEEMCNGVGMDSCTTETKLEYHSADNPSTHVLTVTPGCGTAANHPNKCIVTESGTDYDFKCNELCTTDNCNSPYDIQTADTPAATTIKCVQCTSEDGDDSSCDDGSKAAETCQDNMPYTYNACFTSHTVTLSRDGSTEEHKVVFRGCAAMSAAPPDGCVIGDTEFNAQDKHVSVTCNKMCSGTDGCNNEGVPIGSGFKGSGLICKTCSAGAGGCTSVKETTCKEGENYCYSEVVYAEGDIYRATAYSSVDEDEDVRIISETRSCASSETKPTCDTKLTTIAGADFNVTSCKESCTENTCNDEWPNRPRCIVCSSPSHSDCFGKPLSTRAVDKCPSPAHEYCSITRYYNPYQTDQNELGYMETIMRGCERYAKPNKCDYKDWGNGRGAYTCQLSCTEDLCNQGPLNAAAAKLSMGALFVVIIAMLKDM